MRSDRGRQSPCRFSWPPRHSACALLALALALLVRHVNKGFNGLNDSGHRNPKSIPIRPSGEAFPLEPPNYLVTSLAYFAPSAHHNHTMLILYLRSCPLRWFIARVDLHAGSSPTPQLSLGIFHCVLYLFGLWIDLVDSEYSRPSSRIIAGAHGRPHFNNFTEGYPGRQPVPLTPMRWVIRCILRLEGSQAWVATPENLNQPNSTIIGPGALELIPYFWCQQKWSGQCPAEKKRRPKLSAENEERKKESRRAASARYRLRHREAVLQAGRERAARRRAHLRTLKPGHQDLEAARSRAREASARYRAQNRDALAVKQRLVRKRAYIHKHGIHAHIQRRFDAPIHREPEPESSGKEEDDNDAWGFGRPDPNYIAPRILPSTPSTPTSLVLTPKPYALNPWPFRWSFLYYLNLRHIRPYYLCQRRGSHFYLFFSAFIFYFGRLFASLFPLLDLIMHHCVPPYHPSPGHESVSTHDSQSGCVFYAVWAGRCRGVYSNSWIANDQTNGYTDSVQRGFKKWRELEHWWREKCVEEHKGHCPPFETVTFTLNPPYSTLPSSQPCTRIPTAIVDAPPSAAIVDALPSAAAPAAATLRIAPSALMPAPSPFGASSSRSPSSSSSSSSLFQDDPKEEPITPTLKLNAPPRVTLETRVQLTPTGRARGEALAAAAPRDPALAYAAASSAAAAPAPTVAVMPQAVRQGPLTHSILVTPQPAAAAANAAAPVAVAPRRPRRPHCYIKAFFDAKYKVEVQALRLSTDSRLSTEVT
ncbi:hypothetical protein K438DRAFT_2001198 [Mycena galopus ATCC 62051]|nr:hypothetical protein K438DRAFT_2001198 [Mycena galopus ATCC 62051]